MPQKVQTLHQRIRAIGRGENVQQAIESRDQEGRDKSSAKESPGRVARVAHARDRYGRCQYQAIEEKYLKRFQTLPEGMILEVTHLAREVIVGIPHADGSKDRKGHAKLAPSGRQAMIGREEKETNHQFLVIEVIAVEEIRDCR